MDKSQVKEAIEDIKKNGYQDCAMLSLDTLIAFASQHLNEVEIGIDEILPKEQEKILIAGKPKNTRYNKYVSGWNDYRDTVKQVLALYRLTKKE